MNYSTIATCHIDVHCWTGLAGLTAVRSLVSFWDAQTVASWMDANVTFEGARMPRLLFMMGQGTPDLIVQGSS